MIRKAFSIFLLLLIICTPVAFARQCVGSEAKQQAIDEINNPDASSDYVEAWAAINNILATNPEYADLVDDTTRDVLANELVKRWELARQLESDLDVDLSFEQKTLSVENANAETLLGKGKINLYHRARASQDIPLIQESGFKSNEYATIYDGKEIYPAFFSLIEPSSDMDSFVYVETEGLKIYDQRLGNKKLSALLAEDYDGYVAESGSAIATGDLEVILFDGEALKGQVKRLNLDFENLDLDKQKENRAESMRDISEKNMIVPRESLMTENMLKESSALGKINPGAAFDDLNQLDQIVHTFRDSNGDVLGVAIINKEIGAKNKVKIILRNDLTGEQLLDVQLHEVVHGSIAFLMDQNNEFRQFIKDMNDDGDYESLYGKIFEETFVDAVIQGNKGEELTNEEQIAISLVKDFEFTDELHKKLFALTTGDIIDEANFFERLFGGRDKVDGELRQFLENNLGISFDANNMFATEDEINGAIEEVDGGWIVPLSKSSLTNDEKIEIAHKDMVKFNVKKTIFRIIKGKLNSQELINMNSDQMWSQVAEVVEAYDQNNLFIDTFDMEIYLLDLLDLISQPAADIDFQAITDQIFLLSESIKDDNQKYAIFDDIETALKGYVREPFIDFKKPVLKNVNIDPDLNFNSKTVILDTGFIIALKQKYGDDSPSHLNNLVKTNAVIIHPDTWKEIKDHYTEIGSYNMYILKQVFDAQDSLNIETQISDDVLLTYYNDFFGDSRKYDKDPISQNDAEVIMMAMSEGGDSNVVVATPDAHILQIIKSLRPDVFLVEWGDDS